MMQLFLTTHRNGSGTTAKLERVVRVQRGTPPWPNAIAPVQLLPLRKTLLDARGNALAHLRTCQGRRTTLASTHHSFLAQTPPQTVQFNSIMNQMGKSHSETKPINYQLIKPIAAKPGHCSTQRPRSTSQVMIHPVARRRAEQ